jgi:uncharacterized protein
VILQTTLSLAAAAAIINLWVAIRCGQVRTAEKIMHGDGGSETLIRRMRAHSNFIENTPLALILIAVIELSGKGGQWLAIVGAVFMLGRVAHALGMDSTKANPLRMFGTLSAMLTQLGLAVVCILIALGNF